MDFIRNKEVKRQIVVSSILILFWGGIGIIVDSKAVWIVLSAIISSSAVSLFFTYQRYKKIADFSLHIDRLLHGDEKISFGQFQEGELSVLHDEISKMTRRLIEQAEALKMEKGNLAIRWVDMDFIRNKEVKRQIVVSSILILFWGGIGIIVDSKAVWIVLSAIISSSAVSLFFTYQRYKKIADFSLHIDRLLHGDEKISFGQFQEGELSVLHDEISKMTRRLIEQAEALKMEKGNLANALADISHQLKTPLTSLNILNASLCNEELTDEERYELIREQTMLLSRMEWLIATLLKISKLDAGTITLKPQAVYLKDVVEKAIRPLEIAAELKMQTITQVIPAELKLSLDTDWTAEALGNVIKNCIEHSPEGSTIEIKAIERPLLTQIIIEDSGTGFQEKDIPHLFDRFYQGSGSTIGNAGLGLALAKTIIVNQGGVIQAKNRESGGAKFEICFYRGTA